VDLKEVEKEEKEEDILKLKECKKGFKKAIKRVVLALVIKKLKQFLALKKVIIYSNSVNSIDSLREALKYKVYY
jgi:hypothetical protein